MRAAHRVPSFHDAARMQVRDEYIVTISYHACARLYDVRRARVAPEVVGGDGLRRPAEHDADEEDPRALEHLAEGRHLRLSRLAREHPRDERVDEAVRGLIKRASAQDILLDVIAARRWVDPINNPNWNARPAGL